jgi:hypothetical protein
MKRPLWLIISLAANLLLAAVLFAIRENSSAVSHAVVSIAEPSPVLETPSPAPASVPFRKIIIPWNQIESADYRQYVGNLRSVGCPEWLLRDIIVADIDDLYAQNFKSQPVYFAPWQGAALRISVSWISQTNAMVLRREKRALVKALLGYEWDNHANEVWKQDILTSLNLGFLPDDKACEVLLLKKEYLAAAQNAREEVHFVLLDEDRAQLRNLYEQWEFEMSQLLSGPDLDELDLRAQKDFLLANDIHFDGVLLSLQDVREIVRMTKNFKDMARNEFVSDRPLTEAEQERWNSELNSQIESLLGAERFADYQRAQDPAFRKILDFSQQNNLSQTAAIEIYDARCKANEEANEIKKEEDLSLEERDTALALLKTVTMKAISYDLGGSYQIYLNGPGQWLEGLAQPPVPDSQK